MHKKLSTLGLAAALTSLCLSACSTDKGERTDLSLSINEKILQEKIQKRRLRNKGFVVDVEKPKRVHITNLTTGTARYVDLDWGIKKITLCPACEFASIWYAADDGNQYNALLNLKTTDVIQNLGPTEYAWSNSGQYMALGYPQSATILETVRFEQFLEAATDEEKSQTIHRSVALKSGSGKNMNVLGFYDDHVALIMVGCCDKPSVYGIDLEESQVYTLPCQDEDCRDLDELGEKFQSAKGDPNAYAPKGLFDVKP
jgi:hypothetical protein